MTHRHNPLCRWADGSVPDNWTCDCPIIDIGAEAMRTACIAAVEALTVDTLGDFRKPTTGATFREEVLAALREVQP